MKTNTFCFIHGLLVCCYLFVLVITGFHEAIPNDPFIKSLSWLVTPFMIYVYNHFWASWGIMLLWLLSVIPLTFIIYKFADDIKEEYKIGVDKNSR